ncbi:hypothetical protein AB4304_13910 [Vibrio breoganii]
METTNDDRLEDLQGNRIEHEDGISKVGSAKSTYLKKLVLKYKELAGMHPSEAIDYEIYSELSKLANELAKRDRETALERLEFETRMNIAMLTNGLWTEQDWDTRIKQRPEVRQPEVLFNTRYNLDPWLVREDQFFDWAVRVICAENVNEGHEGNALSRRSIYRILSNNEYITRTNIRQQLRLQSRDMAGRYFNAIKKLLQVKRTTTFHDLWEVDSTMIEFKYNALHTALSSLPLLARISRQLEVGNTLQTEESYEQDRTDHHVGDRP